MKLENKQMYNEYFTALAGSKSTLHTNSEQHFHEYIQQSEIIHHAIHSSFISNLITRKRNYQVDITKSYQIF